MIVTVVVACLLIASTSSFSVHFRRNCGEAKGGGGDVKGARTGQKPTPSPAQATTTDFPCKEDWDKVCTSDSECCSGECQKPFCKILGIDEIGVKGNRYKKTGVKGKKSNTKHKVNTKLIA